VIKMRNYALSWNLLQAGRAPVQKDTFMPNAAQWPDIVA